MSCGEENERKNALEIRFVACARLVLTYCLLGFCYALHVNYKNDVWQGSHIRGVEDGAQVSVPPGEAELNGPLN